METKEFLKRVLGDGYYSVLGLGDRQVQTFHTSIDSVIEQARELDRQGQNAYFGLSTFETDKDRKVTNVKSLSSFYLDLDCGVGKEYENQNEAFKDLKRFLKETGIPRPMLINSGNGIHVYWVLKESVSYEEWYPVALGLKSMCTQHNLLADSSVTADAARVLRVPETHNHKRGEKKPVGFFGTGEFREIDFIEFASLVGASSTTPPMKVDNEESAFVEAMKANSEYSFKNILAKTVQGNGCEQLKNIIENQQDISEPLWRAGLSIATFCNDSERAVHKMSQGHPEYSKRLTEDKAKLIKGPYLCSSFAEQNIELCTNCRHWNEISSPIVLGKSIKRATSEQSEVKGIPKYPKPYFRGENGGVYVDFKTADGEMEQKMIYQNDLYVVKRVMDVEVGEAIVMRLHLPQDGAREFTVPLTAVTSKEELRKHLSMQGIAVLRMDEIMAYTTTWVTQLQAKSVAEQARRQFGWVDDDFEGFVLGSEEITPKEVKFNPPSTPTASLFPSFEPRGTLEDWKDTVNFYNRESFELHQFVVGTSFGSPLMSFSPVNCAALHIYSKESGVGKTTAMIAGASVWGNPEDLIMHERDTYNTKMNRGEIYHNLPMYMDELTNTSGKELSNLAYQLTGGKQRGRMSASSNVERHRGEAWKLLAVTTGNTSMVERISIIKAMPKAEAQRILECRVSKMHFETKEETDIFSSCLQNNYGHAGKIYIRHIMENKEEVKKIIKQVQEKVDLKAGLTAENRFWSILVTCTLTGIILAKRCGLVNYDTKKLFNWAIDRLKENKRQVEDMSVSVEETLNDFIHEHWSNVLWIKSTDDLRTQEGDVTSLIIPEALPRGKLVARYETDLKRAYLVPKPLKAWCGEQQINYNAFVGDLKSKLNAKRIKIRLSKGTHMNLPPTDVISVDCLIDNETKAGDT